MSMLSKYQRENILELLCRVIFATFTQLIAYSITIIIYIFIKYQLQISDNLKQMNKQSSL